MTDADQAVIAGLGFQEEIDRLKAALEDWLGQCDAEIRDALEWQFVGGSKYFRPLTLFGCYRAVHGGPIPPLGLQSAVVVEMFHNVSLIIDDILDKSPERRGKATLHTRYGNLSALMISGYVVAEGYRMLVDDPFSIQLMSELLKRLGVAECLQWRLRRQPLGIEDWRTIASEDTGCMFEVCACLGTRSDVLRRFGHLLGLVYHGCDDVADVRGVQALGGGGDEDLRDGILTLPAAFAIRDPEIRALFCKAGPSDAELQRMAEAFHAQLPEAERYLDRIADEAREEARLFAAAPEPLLALVDYTRQLSQR
jgi:geranylgeranyl diphosphate synthase, type I